MFEAAFIESSHLHADWDIVLVYQLITAYCFIHSHDFPQKGSVIDQIDELFLLVHTSMMPSASQKTEVMILSANSTSFRVLSARKPHIFSLLQPLLTLGSVFQ